MTNFEDLYELELYPKRGISLVRGENALVWDNEGKKYIDCIAGHAVANIGHCNPVLVKAIEDQAKNLISCPASFYNPTRGELLKRLVEITPASLKRAFLCNSGAESIEAAFKFARMSNGKKGVIAAMRGFHGRTLGALSATFNPKYRKAFLPLLEGFSHVPFNNYEKLEAAIDDNTSAVILELVQGEAGVYPANKEYITKVRELCDSKDILLIIDEVQTGFGRTGALFASELYKLEPDILCLSKALGGGFPIGAVLCSDKIKAEFGKHGSTFGGNPLACAAALASIEFTLEHDLAKQAREKGEYLYSKLQALNSDKVREIRQIGLMLGIEIKEKVQPYIAALTERGVLALPAGLNVIRLLPPLTIEYDLLDRVVGELDQVLS